MFACVRPHTHAHILVCLCIGVYALERRDKRLEREERDVIKRRRANSDKKPTLMGERQREGKRERTKYCRSSSAADGAVVLSVFSPSSAFQSSRFRLFRRVIQAWREVDTQVEERNLAEK